MQSHDPKHREEVLQLLVVHRSTILAGILAQVRNFTIAEEIFQEVALVVAEQWGDFQPGTNFLAWARQIARNKVIAYYRDRQRPEFQFSPEAMANIESASASGNLSTAAMQLEDLRDCIAKLNEQAAALITQRYHDGHDCERIARESGRTLTSVHMMLSRIRSRLADCVRAKRNKETH